MNKKELLPIGLAAALSLLPATLLAKATPEELKKIGLEGTELTPVGAIRAGNADGSIPAWTGGLPQKDVPKGQWLDNPFAADKPLFTIDGRSADKYKDQSVCTIDQPEQLDQMKLPDEVMQTAVKGYLDERWPGILGMGNNWTSADIGWYLRCS